VVDEPQQEEEQDGDQLDEEPKISPSPPPWLKIIDPEVMKALRE
jgi:hypothetical protein